MSGRRYFLELGACLVAYAAVLVVSLTALRHGQVAAGWKPVVALLPMAPAAGIIWAVLRQLARMDELQRRLQLEALAFAFAGTAVATFSYGFMENVGYPRVSMFAVWPLMAVLWTIGLFAARWRYQ